MSSKNDKGAGNTLVHKNGSFSSSIGFVIACVGSAVGLGNIWMFPYRLGQYGGAAFLIPYILFVALFGYVGLSAEFGIGRLSGTGTLGSYERCWSEIKIKKHNSGKANKVLSKIPLLGSLRCWSERKDSSGKAGKVLSRIQLYLSKLGKVLGWIPLLGSLGIAIGYSVIIGWVLRFLAGSVTGRLFESGQTSEYFSQATGEFGSVPWHAAVIIITMIILIFGAVKYIERVNKIMMPVFFVLFAIIAVRVAFLPGAVDGYKFLFIPDWSKLLEVDTWVMAMGQAFFSLSITGSGMIVYGSYLSKKEDIPKASVRTAFFDTVAAMLSALAIMPAVFAFGIEPKSGPPLMFITIPGIFDRMPMGRLFAVLFFLSVAFAGITSLVNMFEAVVESWQHKLKLNRKVAVALCAAIAFAVGIFIEEEGKLGSWMDFITIIVVPFGAVLGAFSIYYILGLDKILKELNIGRSKPLKKIFGWLGKYFYVPITILVFVLGIVYGGIG